MTGFHVLDTNRDGVITWHDFTLRLEQLDFGDDTSKQLSYAAYWALWTSLCTAMDLNKDHIITATEYNAYLQAMTLDPELAHNTAADINENLTFTTNHRGSHIPHAVRQELAQLGISVPPYGST